MNESYDKSCEVLASAFLSDHEPFRKLDADEQKVLIVDLSRHIQGAIEDYLNFDASETDIHKTISQRRRGER